MLGLCCHLLDSFIHNIQSCTLRQDGRGLGQCTSCSTVWGSRVSSSARESVFLGNFAGDHTPQWAITRFMGTLLEQASDLLPPCFYSLQVLRYFDYVFTGVFTFEMVIKVSAERARDPRDSTLKNATLRRWLPQGIRNVWCVRAAARTGRSERGAWGKPGQGDESREVTGIDPAGPCGPRGEL